MPPRTTYPLEALRGERARDERARTFDMAAAVAAANDAETRAAAASARATAAAVAVRALIDDGRGARAGSIAIADRHAQVMRRAAIAARAASDRAAAVVSSAREDLGDARGRARVVDNHRDRWRDDQARARERRSDD